MAIGCAPGYVSDCAVGDVKTWFVTEEGRINEMVTRMIDNTDPLLRLGNRTKRQFPSGMSDVVTDVILTRTLPASSSGSNWAAVKAATCDESPCCTEPEMIRYGNTKFTGCLSQKSYRTPDFCVIDLTFKHRRDQQIGAFLEMLPEWTMHVQKFWYRYSFRSVTPSMVLNQDAGNPVTFGAYATWAKPTSALTPDHLDEIYLRLMDSGANLSPFTVSGGTPFQVALIGHEEFRFLDNLEKEAANLLGATSPSIQVDAFGRVRTIRNFVFIAVQYPTRLGDAPGGGYIEIDSHIEMKTDNGYESMGNPDYRDPTIAKYVETIFWNAEAAHWLTAPDFSGVGQLQFGAQDFSGRFMLVNFPTPCDPRAKNAYLLAEYMNGMIPRHPRRAMTVLSLAVHIRGCDRTAIVCGHPGQPAENAIPINTCAEIPNVPGQMSFRTEPTYTIPVLGAGEGYYLRTRKGALAAIQQIVYFGGTDACFNSIIVQLADPAIAVCRKCDPWIEIVATSLQYPTSVTPGDDCALCASEEVADTFAPTVVVSGPSCHDAGDPFTAIIAFSEVVVGTPTVTVVGGAIGVLATTDQTVFTGTVTPTAPTSTVTLSVAAAEVTDAALNDNLVSNTYYVPPCDGEA